MIIRNIWGIGRNYAKHAAELNNPIPEEPLVFLKAGSCASVNSTDIVLPWWVKEVHHEVELALKLNYDLRVLEGAVALDLTERQLQNKAKEKGLPWTAAKSFPNACAVSSFFTLRHFEEIYESKIHLWVNDELRQSGVIKDMLTPLPKLVKYVVDYYPVCAGDLILTGTPAGVGPMKAGDKLKAQIEGHITHLWNVLQDAPPAEPKVP